MPETIREMLGNVLHPVTEAETSGKASKKFTHVTPEFVDKKAAEYSFEEGLEVVRSRRKLWKEKRFGQEQATVDLKGVEAPALLAAIGDIHWGSVYTDNDRFMRDISLIEQAPNAYILLMSNLIDNAIPKQFPDGMLSNEIHPEEQVITMRALVKRLSEEGKILAAVTSPCHEGWTGKATGQDINRLLFDKMPFPVLDNGGMLTVDLGDQEYKIGMFHQIGPFNSNFNKSHGVQQMQRLRLQGKADIVAAAHHHVGEALHTWAGNNLGENNLKDVAYLRTGCYKIDDKWVVGRYGTQGEPGGQSVMLWPDKRRMLPFLDIETAADVQKAIYRQEKLNAVGLLGMVDEVLK